MGKLASEGHEKEYTFWGRLTLRGFVLEGKHCIALGCMEGVLVYS
jgi:hypothetical protein